MAPARHKKPFNLESVGAAATHANSNIASTGCTVSDMSYETPVKHTHLTARTVAQRQRIERAPHRLHIDSEFDYCALLCACTARVSPSFLLRSSTTPSTIAPPTAVALRPPRATYYITLRRTVHPFVPTSFVPSKFRKLFFSLSLHTRPHAENAARFFSETCEMRMP